MKTIFLFLLVLISMSANSQTIEEYEYLTMTLIRREIRLSIGSETFERKDVRNEMAKDNLDSRPLLKRIQEFEKQGWQMVSSNAFPFSDVEVGKYVMMRRKVPKGDD